MDRNAVCAALVPALLLYACDRVVMPDDGTPLTESAPSDPASVAPIASAPPPTMVPPVADGVNDGNPDLTPSTLTPEAERALPGARNVLLSFARALELKEFDQAWALLSEGDKTKWSEAAFARNFAGIDDITVAVADGTTDGAAGSIYYNGPIVITGTDRDGRPIRFEGETVLKRVNDVDGATAAQLRWRFDRLTLDWTH